MTYDVHELPQLIAEDARKVAELSHEIADLRHRNERIELECLIEVLRATNGQGKPLHSNETARQTAQQEALYDRPEWLVNRDRIAECELQRAETQAQLEQRRHEFRLGLIDRQAEIADRLCGADPAVRMLAGA
ncbi:MAG: hypothetical protein KF868_12555 [Acidobacteria bacterium]|nr:hypothetical protein [Acidobacteriota bacterium]MCW5968693.1 hypothetical protein [Blastocatellales bacterium]